MSSSSPFAVTTSTTYPPSTMSTLPVRSSSTASRPTSTARFGMSPWISPCHAVHEPKAVRGTSFPHIETLPFTVSKALLQNKPRRPSPLSNQILVRLDELEPSSCSKSSAKPSISRLCYPFVKSKSPVSKSKFAITVSSDDSCALPAEPKQDLGTQDPPAQSSTSPTIPSSHPSRNPHPIYRHCGYSHQALTHIKWFWITREEEWEEKAGPVRRNKPQLDTSFLEAALDDPFTSLHNAATAHKKQDRMHPLHQPQHKLPPMTVYPRRGDLTALRDPYCTQIDHLFADLPAWTIGKTLWMYDMHIALQDRAHLAVEPPTPSDVCDETESETEYTPAPSVIFSDDSDITLVESETEADLLPVVRTSSCASDSRSFPSDFGFGCCTNHSFSSLCDQASSSTASFGASSAQSSVVDWSRTAYLEPPIMSSNGLSKPSTRQSGWRTNWYRRWEYMIQLSRSQSSQGPGINAATPSS